ncbi:helix-turn-helix domain-containing protein [bacterium]|nr:helix-turn-helix domain-containing protein [bacterium]
MNLQEIVERLGRIESALDQLVAQRTIKEYYSTSEVARIVKRSEFTVREWCRLGRIAADKRPCGRGRSQEWMIPHDELLRFQCEGLLPFEN